MFVSAGLSQTPTAGEAVCADLAATLDFFEDKIAKMEMKGVGWNEQQIKAEVFLVLWKPSLQHGDNKKKTQQQSRQP